MGIEDKSGIGRRSFLKAGGIVVGALGLSACNLPREEVGIERQTPTSHPTSGFTKEPATAPDVTPSPTKDPTPESTKDPEKGYLEKYLYPALLDVAARRRESVASNDPEFWNRVDKELNKGRINFILLGIGSEGVLTDSIQIMSLDTQENEVKVISIPRDLEAPEITRFRGYTRPYRINQAHYVGGLPLVERIYEDATGLSSDFVMVMDMGVLPRAVKDVFHNRLEVCIPWEINDPLFGHYSQGMQTLSGEDVLRVSRARYYGTTAHRSYIQQYVLSAMLSEAKDKASGGLLSVTGFLRKALMFYEKETKNEGIETNFNSGLFLELGFNLAKQIALGGGDGELSERIDFPSFTDRFSVSVEGAGDPYDIYRKHIVGGDSKSEDLVNGYWTNSREEVKEFLTREVDENEESTFEKTSEVCE